MIEDEEDQYCKCLMDEGELDLEEKHFICMHAALSLCDGKSIRVRVYCKTQAMEWGFHAWGYTELMIKNHITEIHASRKVLIQKGFWNRKASQPLTLSHQDMPTM